MLMPDVVPPASAVSPSAAPAPISGTNNIIVETTLYSVPQRIQQLNRQIEVSGPIAEPPGGPTITLNTMIGPLVILLPQMIAAQRDKFIQQLMTLFQNQRPLTVVMQPGNPPTQGYLMLPQISTTTQNAPEISNLSVPATQLPINTAPPLVPNTVLSAIVLPEESDFMFLPQGAMQGLTPEQAATYTALNPQYNFAPVPDDNASPIVPTVAQNLMSTEEAITAPLKQALAQDITAKINQFLAPIDTQNAQIAASPLRVPSPTPPDEVTIASLEQTLAEEAPTKATLFPTPLETSNLQTVGSGLSAPLPASISVLFQPGTELNIRIVAVISPAPQGTAPQIPPLLPNQVLATVTDSGPNGRIALKIGDATLFVRQPVSAPPGTQLVVTVDPARSDDPAPLPLPGSGELSTLPQIISALMQIDPTAARQIIAATIPQPNQTLPGTLLFFLSAINQGDLRSWLGDNAVDALMRAGKVSLIAKLADDMQQSVQSARDPVVGEWRTYSVPLYDNNHLAMFYFHIHSEHRRHGQPQGKGEGEGKTVPSQVRFLIDVRMSRLGDMQLDGFLRPKRLDIMMRSERELPPGFDRDLRGAYARTMEAIGYTGAINFQSGRMGWINVQKTAAAGAAVVT